MARQAAEKIKNLHRRLTVNEQRTNTTSLQANVSRANINKLQQQVGAVPDGTSLQGEIGTVPNGQTVQGQIGTVPGGKTLQSQLNDLYARIGDPGDTGAVGLKQNESEFLSTLSIMTAPANFPLSDNPASGNTYLNQCIDVVNSLINKLHANGYMH